MNNIVKITLAFAALSLLIPVSSFARKYKFEEGYTFKRGNLEMKVEAIEIVYGWNGLAINFAITNNGTEETNFPSDDFEILNSDTKASYYNCTKDKEMVTIPFMASTYNVLSNKSTIKPDRMIKGSILILAKPDELKSLKNFELLLDKESLKVTSKR